MNKISKILLGLCIVLTICLVFTINRWLNCKEDYKTVFNELIATGNLIEEAGYEISSTDGGNTWNLVPKQGIEE